MDIAFSLKLPRGYRPNEVLAFHARDPEALAERTGPGAIEKGLVLEGKPVVLRIALRGASAECRAEGSSPGTPKMLAALQHAARGMLGLSIDPGPFERLARSDPLLGPVIARQAGLRVPQAATPFEAITWAIVGQQVNVAFAITLRRTLIGLAGQRHESGLWCYPDAPALASLDAEDLGRRKFSRAKAETVIRVARLVTEGTLPLDPWRHEGTSAETIEAALLAVKGIGPWTVHYTLLRGFGHADCSLHGDVALRSAVQLLTGATTRLDAEAARIWLERYRPHRSMAAAHLWASLRLPA